MADWLILGGLAAGAAALVGRGVADRRGLDVAGAAAGLAPAEDLGHLSAALQRTALWHLGDGGFESRVLHGARPRPAGDLAITAFDLETLRERRGEWAWLPVEAPFRLAGRVSVVACQVPRALPHLVLKHAGRSDELEDDDRVARLGHVAKLARDRLGLARRHPADLPPGLAGAAAGGAPPPTLAAALPPGWRAWGDGGLLGLLLAHGGRGLLAAAARRDLVVELIDDLVVLYLAGRRADGGDAVADLVAAALAVGDGVVAATPSPRASARFP